MRFFVRKRRQPPAVIIVALIDVLIVVLIFLMVTTTFKKPPATSLKVALPDSNHATKPGANESPPLVLVIEENGNLRLGPDALPVTLDRLKTELAAARLKNPRVKLALHADKKAPFGPCLRAMDAARDANVPLQINAVQIPTTPAPTRH